MHVLAKERHDEGYAQRSARNSRFTEL
jgi:hypothetical protein